MPAKARRPIANSLSLIDQVSQTHQTIIITKRGKPVARLVPLEEEKPRRLFGCFAGHVLEEGDILSSTGEEWGVERE
jgi:prevent-host-death family protein